MKVGVLALQGDFREHVRVLATAGAVPVEIRTVAELADVDRLAIPGGESTTIAKLAHAGDLRSSAGTRAGRHAHPRHVLDDRDGGARARWGAAAFADGRHRPSQRLRPTGGFVRSRRGRRRDRPPGARVFIRAPYRGRGLRCQRALLVRGPARRPAAGQPARGLVPPWSWWARPRSTSTSFPSRGRCDVRSFEMGDIKRKKAANDAKRSNQFAKLLRAIEVAARRAAATSRRT